MYKKDVNPPVKSDSVASVQQEPEDEAIIDSGAAASITNVNKIIEFYRPVSRNFHGANGSAIVATGTGSVNVNGMKLPGVYHCPSA